MATRSPRSAAFTDAMDEQPNDYLASFYVDLAGLAEASGAAADLGSITTASAVLVAEPDGLKLSGSAPLSAGSGADPSAAPTAAEQGTLSGWMPERTVAEITVFGLRSALEEPASRSPATCQRARKSRAPSTRSGRLPHSRFGVDLDADVLPLLDGETALAIGGIGADGMPTGQLLLRPSDSDAAVGVLGRIADRIGSSGGNSSTETLDGIDITTIAIPDTGEVAFGVVDGVVVIGLSRRTLRQLPSRASSGLTLDGDERLRAGIRRCRRAGGDRGLRRRRDGRRAAEPARRAS